MVHLFKGRYTSVLPMCTCDGYDDIYNMTPERVISGYASLGFGDTVNMYIGASHYYEKAYDSADYKLNVKSNYPFNSAFEAWYSNYTLRLKEIGVQKLIHSISMENVNAPYSWVQRTWNGNFATTKWTPTPFLCSFTNQNVRNFYLSLVLNLARLSSEAGIQPIIQLGEPWWWFIEDGESDSPCFYDDATKQMYYDEFGKEMHIFRSGQDIIQGYEDVLYFLRDKNGEFSHLLRDAIKNSYPSAQFTVLFFPPSVLDKKRVPMMMSIVNFPKEHWKYPNLDFFMLEDYDYIIDNDMEKHDEALTYIQSNLAYSNDKIHYFCGFVLNQEKLDVWKRIDQAINDSFNLEFAKTYIWAFAQIKRDGWRPQRIIYSSKYSGNYKGPISVNLSCIDADSIIYTLDGSIPSLSHGTTYSVAIDIIENTVLTVRSIKNGLEDNPIVFKYTIPVRSPIQAKLYVDGSEKDWSDISSVSSGDRIIFDLTAIQSESALFMLVRGTQMDTSSNFYIDTTDSHEGGFKALPWSDGNANYMISNNSALFYSGSGQDWSWNEIGTAQIAKTPSVVEVSVPLSLLGLTAPKEIKIGFGRTFINFAPPTNCKMMIANKVFVLPPQITKINIVPTNINICVSNIYSLQAIITPDTISSDKVIWESSNTNLV